MTRILFLAVVFLGSTAYGQSLKTDAPQPEQNRAPQLSTKQQEVLAAEESMHRYEQQRDAKRFLSLWDDNFVGWPDYEPRPVRKTEIEQGTVEEFQKPTPHGPPLPLPKPEAIGIFGDVAVTHYFWPEADQTSPTVFRTTHTWRKGPQGWQIIGGMACEVPRLPSTGSVSAPAIPARPEDVATIEGIIDASLKSLTGPVGAPRDWSRYRSLCDPAIRLVSSSFDDKGNHSVTRWNLETYMADADDYLVKTGFQDRKLACTPTRFGNVATVTCGFEGLEGAKVVERGVAMFQLYNDGKRWWINSVVWERERPGNPIPREFLPKN